MTASTKQLVCDQFAEQVLNDLFGKPKVPAFIDLFLRNKGFDIQQKFDLFDSFIQEFMNEDGTIKAAELKSVVAEKAPRFADFIPNEDFHLSDQWAGAKTLLKSIIGG